MAMILRCAFSQKVSKEELNIHSNRPMINRSATSVQNMCRHQTVCLATPVKTATPAKQPDQQSGQDCANMLPSRDMVA